MDPGDQLITDPDSDDTWAFLWPFCCCQIGIRILLNIDLLIKKPLLNLCLKARIWILHPDLRICKLELRIGGPDPDPGVQINGSKESESLLKPYRQCCGSGSDGSICFGGSRNH
jgi:hypothetical protein